MFSNLSKLTKLSALVAVCLVAFATPSHADCDTSANNCDATTSISLYTGSNPPFCQNGADVYEVTVTITCNGIGGGTASDTVAVCSLLATPIQISVGGVTHTIAPKPGKTWGDVNSDCKDLSHVAR